MKAALLGKALRVTEGISQRTWLRAGKIIWLITGAVALVLSAAGIGTSIVPTANSGLETANVLLILAVISFLAAGAMQAVHARWRIGLLRQDLVAKEGYKLFVDHAVEGFFRMDADGAFIEANGALAHIFGEDPNKDVCAKLNGNLEAYYPDAGHRAEFRTQLRVQGSVQEFISKVRRQDNRMIWVTENARAIVSPAGKFLYYAGTTRDITAQRDALQSARLALAEAREGARAKAAFVAAMSHELRTPLNAVLGFSDLMLQQIYGPIDDRYRGYLVDIHNNGQRLFALISDVLDFSRIEGQSLELNDNVFALDEVIRLARDKILESTPESPKIDLKLTSRLLMRGDEKRISQVITNLLSNAVKFTGTQGCITIKAYHGSDGSLLVEMADTGIGIAHDRIAIALEPFKQIDGRLARRFDGLGLGLPLAKALVELHGGRLAVTSTLGKGTTINIAFPRERAPSATTFAAAPQPLARAAV